jgi:hypothetical protein
MDINENYRFMTTRQQKLLLFMFPANNITFKSQPIYNNQQQFRRSMRQLVNFGKVERKIAIQKNMKEDKYIYYLNIWGKLYVEKNIIAFNDKNA